MNIEGGNDPSPAITAIGSAGGFLCAENAAGYVGIKKLDGYILHELISAIYVQEKRVK